MVFRIGSSTSNTFERPVSLSRSESFLFVCNERGCNVRSVNLETYAVRDHRRFAEPVYRRPQFRRICPVTEGRVF